MPNQILLAPLSAEKSRFVIILFTSGDNLIMFHQNLLFDHVEEFCTNFLLDFRPSRPRIFSLFIDFFLPHHFSKTLIPIGSIFTSCSGPSYYVLPGTVRFHQYRFTIQIADLEINSC